jgi:hypothetical protein
MAGLLFFFMGFVFKITYWDRNYSSNSVLTPESFGTKDIHIHFQNSRLDPNFTDCENTSFVNRQISLTPIPAILESDQIWLAESIYLALKELLAGPSVSEKSDGYLTSVNSGVKINSVIVKTGVARIDFDEKLNEGVAGSCRVTAIRAQIDKTVKQFGNVREVIISVNGDSENILQP